MESSDNTDPRVEMLRRLEQLPAAAGAVVERLGRSFEPSVLMVGGAVRDLLGGCVPLDLDLVLEAPPEVITERLGGELRAHARFGTATVHADGFTYDIAQARRERYAHPGALPDVEPASLQEDLGRRDFSVNAIAVALTGPRAGQLSAVPGALDDLAARRLRVLHDASFRDDPIRLLRLVRYRARLGFEVEPGTLGLARAAIGDRALRTVSGARVGHELRLLTREADPVRALVSLQELGLHRAIDPGFGIGDPTFARAALELLPADGRRDLLITAVAVLQVPGPRLAPLLDDLAYPATSRDAIEAAAVGGARLAEAIGRAARPSEIALAVGAGSPELVALAGALGPAGPAREWLDRLRHAKLAIDGADLLRAGIAEGPGVGAGLAAARAALLDGRAGGREEQLAEALRSSS